MSLAVDRLGRRSSPSASRSPTRSSAWRSRWSSCASRGSRGGPCAATSTPTDRPPRTAVESARAGSRLAQRRRPHRGVVEVVLRLTFDRARARRRDLDLRRGPCRVVLHHRLRLLHENRQRHQPDAISPTGRTSGITERACARHDPDSAELGTGHGGPSSKPSTPRWRASRIRVSCRHWPSGGRAPAPLGGSIRSSARATQCADRPEPRAVVVWIDVSNEPCLSAYRLLSQLADSQRIRLSVRQLPLADVHPLSLPAAEALEAAAAQGKFFDLLDDFAQSAVRDAGRPAGARSGPRPGSRSSPGGGSRLPLPHVGHRADPTGDGQQCARGSGRIHQRRTLRRDDHKGRPRPRPAAPNAPWLRGSAAGAPPRVPDVSMSAALSGAVITYATDMAHPEPTASRRPISPVAPFARGELLPRPPAADAGRALRNDVRPSACLFVARLHEDPAALAGPRQSEPARQLLARKHERQVVWVLAHELHRALVPDDHRAASARCSRVHPLELAGLERVVLDRYREPPRRTDRATVPSGPPMNATRPRSRGADRSGAWSRRGAEPRTWPSPERRRINGTRNPRRVTVRGVIGVRRTMIHMVSG